MFHLPTFNLNAEVFDRVAVHTPLGPPRFVTGCNLAWGRRVQVSGTGGTEDVGVQAITLSLLLPPGTDVRPWYCYSTSKSDGDLVVVPAGSGRIYQVRWVDDVGKGFVNEHRCALIVATADWGLWPSPIP